MLRQASLAAVLVLATSSVCVSQEWARKMFDSAEHNFGAVARGSKIEHRFVITNLYEEDVHIVGVRSSCGCTSPTITKNTLKTYETTELVAAFNTKSHLGQKSATLTVTFDKPFYAETQIKVSGYIRTDVVLSPSEIDFGTVPVAAEQEKTVTIDYAGRDNWELLEAKSSNPHLEVELLPKTRTSGKISYGLRVKLKDDAPVGYINEQITLITNDKKGPELPVTVEGRIEAALSASPSPLVLGVVPPGQTVTKKLVVRGKQPFKIMGVECPDGCMQVESSEESKPVHLIPVTFTAGQTPGKVETIIRLQTDLAGGNMEVTAVAEVGAPAASK